MSTQYPQDPNLPQPQWVQAPPPKKKRTGLKVVLGGLALIGVATVASCTAAIAGGASTDVAQNPTQVASARAQSTSAPKADPTKKAEPKMTTAEEQAVKAAESYVRSGHFSKKGLVQQLTSEYGEGFSKKDADFAVAYVDPDFNEEARQAAESYLKSGHFSHDGLMQQLTSEYGEQFTQKQAAQAVKSVGL